MDIRPDLVTILAIETSCDETAVSIVRCAKNESGEISNEIVGQRLFSQADLHSMYGGVYPHLAKREHAKRIFPLVIDLLKEVGPKLGDTATSEPANFLSELINEISIKDSDLIETFSTHRTELEKIRPNITHIAVTVGPGLEPALWVGINAAKLLATLWNIPLIPSNHMEGHIYSGLINKVSNPDKLFPALALLISGGHTEFVRVNTIGTYERIGTTKDDAIGEAFDKTARLLDLPYPGGPKLSALAEQARTANLPTDPEIALPRPMLDSHDLYMSFSGLKTAVLYLVKRLKADPTRLEADGTLKLETKQLIAREFEASVSDVIAAKLELAIGETTPKSLLIGGGVIANNTLKKRISVVAEANGIPLYLPETEHATDNASMIGLAAGLRLLTGTATVYAPTDEEQIKTLAAHGTLDYTRF